MRILKCVTLIILTQVISLAQWFWQNPYPTGNTIHTVEIGVSGNAWLGSKGNIFKTTDYGTTWNSFKNNNQDEIFSIFMVNDIIGYAVGGNVSYDTFIMKTTDGGESWFYQYEAQTGTFRSVFFNDEFNGFACGFLSVARTTDGGSNWDVISDINFGVLRSVHFASDSVGWCVGNGKIFKTTDAGLSWEEKISPNADAHSVFFLNESVGWMTGSFSYLYFSVDGGETWNSRVIPEMSTLYSIIFKNSEEGYICGRSNKIIKTTNGGDSWFVVHDGENWSEIFSIDINDEWGIGGGSELLNMDSLGTWRETGNRIKEYIYFNDIDFPESKTAYIVGNSSPRLDNNSRILKTTDSGSTWSLDFLTNIESGDFLIKCEFINSAVGFIVTEKKYSNNYNRILKTSNGGADWYTVWESENYSLQDIQFLNSFLGFACGGGVLVKTSDQGETWIEIEQFDYKLYNELFFLDDQQGFLAGKLNKVIKTTDGGESWIDIQINSTYGSINKLYFLNPVCGWALSYGFIYQTTDAGDTWISMGGLTYGNYIEIDFQDNNIGWLCSEEGYNWKTTDGGNTWLEEERIPFPYVNACAYLSSDSIIVVGDYSTIVSKFDLPIIVSVESKELKEGKVEVSSFLLHQNYPNPFNPTTKIKFTVPTVETGHAPSLQTKLIVFDILGREKATLLNKPMPAGTHEVEFDATGLPSGVYFYKLTTGKFTETKKMILLR